MEATPPTPKESPSAILAKLLRQLGRKSMEVVSSAMHSVRTTFAAAHERTLGHPLAKKVASKLVGWGLILAGVGVAQWDEYGLALGLFSVGSFILFLQAYHWQEWEKNKTLFKLLRGLCMAGAFLMIAVAYPVTNAKRGDKPWSDVLHRLTFVAPLHCPRCFVPTPENWAEKQKIETTIRTHSTKSSGAPREVPAGMAQLQFSFFTQDAEKFPILETTAPLVNGIVEVDVIALGKGTVPAKNGWLTLIICNECHYATEPPNMVALPKENSSPEMIRQLRHMRFEEIYPGTISWEMKLRIIPPPTPYDKQFLIAGRYVCDNCPPDEPKRQQVLTVNVAAQQP